LVSDIEGGTQVVRMIDNEVLRRILDLRLEKTV
jgi:hypothetical protein